MSEARDRLSRNEDLIDIYSRRRQRSVGFQIFEDEPGTTGTPGRVGMAGGGGLGGSRRIGFGRYSHGTRTRANGRENISPAGRGRARGRRTLLPSWYPRAPLRDITSIVRAIERTRARLRESEGEQAESVVPQDHTVADPSESTSGSQLEDPNSMITPRPTLRSSRYRLKSAGKVSKILLDVTQQNSSAGGSDYITPQRKLLNSIDTVEEAVMEELHKLKRTPTARKEEREKRIRTLMSMR